MKIKTLLIIIACSISLLTINAQPGTLRTDFAENGLFSFDISYEDEVQDLGQLSDGSIIVSGYLIDDYYAGYIMRISETGQEIWSKRTDVNGSSSNVEFQGLIVRNDEIYVQSNSYNNATEQYEIVVMKFDKDGNPMSNFGINGQAKASYGAGILGFEMNIDEEGNLYVFGRSYYFGSNLEDGIVAKFKPTGILDTNFGENGISVIGVGSYRTGFLEGTIINGEIYAVGWFHNTAGAFSIDEDGVIVKLKADGSLDFNFGISGVISFDVSSYDIINDIVQHGEDHILIGASSGVSTDDIYILRYNLEGQLDLTFGNNGSVVLDYGNDDDVEEILVRPDLGIYICASINNIEDFALISLDASGTVNSTFGIDGKIVIDIENNDNASEGILLANGDVLLGGESNEGNDSDFAIVRIAGYSACSNYESNMTLSDCEMVSFDGITYNQTGTHILEYQTTSGCDSTIILNVEIKETSKETLDLSACTSINVNAETYTNSGTYVQTLVAHNGCDSTLTINIDILNSSQETIAISDCMPVFINDIMYSTSGTYTQTLVASNGCDSTLTLNVNIEMLESTIMEDESGGLVSVNEAGQYQWYNCSTSSIISGATANTYIPTETGDYALIISSEMCVDTSDCISVTISGVNEFSDISDVNVYPNPANSFILIKNIDLINISKINLYNLSGQTLPAQFHETNQGIKIEISHLISGLYYLQMLDNLGDQKVVSFVKE